MFLRVSISALIIIIIYAVFNLLDTQSISIDKTYMINLDRSPQRYKIMQDKLSSLGFSLPITRFSAIDGKKVKFTNNITKESFTGQEILERKIWLKGSFNATCLDTRDKTDKIIVNNLNQPYYNRRIPGEVGVVFSQKKIWQEIIDKGYKNTLILEDDLLFIPFFTGLFKMGLANAPKDYDLLFLNFKNHGQAFDGESDNSIIRLFLTAFDRYIKNPFWKRAKKNILSSQAYILTNEGAKRLLACDALYSNDSFIPIDVTMTKCINDKKIKAYASKPRLIDCDHSSNNVSDIAEPE